MKLVSMANKQEKESMPVECCDDRKYPYGTEISLGNEQLAALGLKDLPKVGSMVTIQAKAKVVSTGAREESDGETECSLCLQITDLGLETSTSTTDAQKAAVMFKEED